MHRILIDISHNEQVTSISEKIFPDHDFLFSFTQPTDDLSDVVFLQQFDIILLGNPKPITENEWLFQPNELQALKKYVADGGNLLLTSGARGDYNFTHEFGSLRVLYNLTGIIQYHYALLFHTDPQIYKIKKSNLVISEFPSHPIFHDFTSEDYLVFGKSTFVSLGEDLGAESLLFAPTNTHAHFYQNKTKTPIRSEPLLVVNEYYRGKVVTLSSSSIFSKNPLNGYKVGANSKLINGIINWMLE